jgi:signal peptidase I
VLWKIIVAVIVLLGITLTVFQVALVPTGSMERTVLIGDHILMNRMGYWFSRVQRGDVVSFHPPGNRKEVYLKRAVAVGGDRIEIRDGIVYVNGGRISEPYVQHMCARCVPSNMQLRVPEGSLFVMGDNRELSEDSRVFGTVPESAVVGRPVMVLWSFSIPTEKWMRAPVTAYLNHPLTHFRWARLFRSLQ